MSPIGPPNPQPTWTPQQASSTPSNTDLLDTPQGCVHTLTEVNREMAEFTHEWATAAGELKQKEKRQERLHMAALRGLIGEDMKVAEKNATAHAAVEKQEPGLAERIEELTRIVEESKVRFTALEKRGSFAQSTLQMHRNESKFNGYVKT